eukprot:CAMPEP_0194100150 /NCGR_PEP_ID=MMETSP0150-20130528/1122_1 /TAXON_ID=122233 /ORGANISM="Chaetoceros debilis, Strain MM31A-1" /LENGTH=270 /DNA_ID=CAMNT_0038786479 /DNA_START=129 /DNA_END=938 /DNA_ORIENTATION=-
MKLYIYRGLENEKVPKDVTHVIVDNSVTVIKKKAFEECKLLVCVIMGDNVKRIEGHAFRECIALRFIRLSKTLEFIGYAAFYGCESLEALFLPSSVTSIVRLAFDSCRSLRLMILPNDINLGNIAEGVVNHVEMIIIDTAINQIAENEGVEYETTSGGGHFVTDASLRQVNEWLIHHMDEAPFHKLCYNSSITTRHINDYLNEHGNDSTLNFDMIHGMTPLHMLSMNPHAPADAIAALLDVNVEVAFCLDHEGKISLDYARDYNVGGLVA